MVNNTTYDVFSQEFPYAIPKNTYSQTLRSVEKENVEKYFEDTYRKDNALEEAIAIIRKSIEDEKDDEVFYTVLLSQAPTEEDRKIIQSIIGNEKKHNKMLKELYAKLTQKTLPQSMMSRKNDSHSEYLKNLEKAMFSELAAVEKYRSVLAAMPDKEKYAIIFEILTDELKHAIKYNFLITKNMYK